jgi:hypothetical protein
MLTDSKTLRHKVEIAKGKRLNDTTILTSVEQEIHSLFPSEDRNSPLGPVTTKLDSERLGVDFQWTSTGGKLRRNCRLSISVLSDPFNGQSLGLRYTILIGRERTRGAKDGSQNKNIIYEFIDDARHRDNFHSLLRLLNDFIQQDLPADEVLDRLHAINVWMGCGQVRFI